MERCNEAEQAAKDTKLPTTTLCQKSDFRFFAPND